MTPRLTLRDPCDLAAAVPFLLGFHPRESLVVLGLRGDVAAVVQRWDLAADVTGLADAIAGLITGAADGVLLAGYGEAYLVRRVIRALRERLGPLVLCAVRVEGDRCFCELCDTCTPPGGARFDFDSSRVATEAVVAGLTALPSRDDLARLVAPTGGAPAEAMALAVERADAEFSRFRVGHLLTEGLAAVDAALASGRGGERLDDDRTARLTLLLHSLRVRDHAWESTDHEPWQLSLWADLTRRAAPILVAPVASLLAFAAWRDGNGPLASVALERALGCDPAYAMALLVHDAMLQGVPPARLDWPVIGGKPTRRRGGSKGAPRVRRARGGAGNL